MISGYKVLCCLVIAKFALTNSKTAQVPMKPKSSQISNKIDCAEKFISGRRKLIWINDLAESLRLKNIKLSIINLPRLAA